MPRSRATDPPVITVRVRLPEGTNVARTRRWLARHKPGEKVWLTWADESSTSGALDAAATIEE